MFIVAGLPKATHRRAIARLRERFPEAEIIGSASTSDDGQLYRKQLCSNLATAVTSFAVRKRLKSPAEPAVPRLILLLYVPSDDDDLLLRTFDFAVFSEPLVALQARDLRGFQLRHSQEAVDAALETALARDSRRQQCSGQSQR